MNNNAWSWEGTSGRNFIKEYYGKAGLKDNIGLSDLKGTEH